MSRRRVARFALLPLLIAASGCSLGGRRGELVDVARADPSIRIAMPYATAENFTHGSAVPGFAAVNPHQALDEPLRRFQFALLPTLHDGIRRCVEPFELRKCAGLESASSRASPSARTSY